MFFSLNNIKPPVLSLPSLLLLGEFLPVVDNILACFAHLKILPYFFTYKPSDFFSI